MEDVNAEKRLGSYLDMGRYCITYSLVTCHLSLFAAAEPQR